MGVFGGVAIRYRQQALDLTERLASQIVTPCRIAGTCGPIPV
jgi:hypothetical protein